MNFEFKVTAWERVTVSEEHEHRVLQAIKDGKITTSNDIYDFLGEEGDDNLEYKVIPETETPVSLEDNKGYSTIEVSEGRGIEQVILYKNGK